MVPSSSSRTGAHQAPKAFPIRAGHSRQTRPPEGALAPALTIVGPLQRHAAASQQRKGRASRSPPACLAIIWSGAPHRETLNFGVFQQYRPKADRQLSRRRSLRAAAAAGPLWSEQRFIGRIRFQRPRGDGENAFLRNSARAWTRAIRMRASGIRIFTHI